MATTQAAKNAPSTRPQPLDPSFPHGALHVAKAKGAHWETGLREYFEYRDLGIADATQGKVLAQVIRPAKPCDEPGDLHTHKLNFQMVYVLKGWARVAFGELGERRLEEGDCLYQSPEIEHRVVEYSDDYTVIEITVPADFETVSLAP